jgi:hypothetical protein
MRVYAEHWECDASENANPLFGIFWCCKGCFGASFTTAYLVITSIVVDLCPTFAATRRELV